MQNLLHRHFYKVCVFTVVGSDVPLRNVHFLREIKPWDLIERAFPYRFCCWTYSLKNPYFRVQLYLGWIQDGYHVAHLTIFALDLREWWRSEHEKNRKGVLWCAASIPVILQEQQYKQGQHHNFYQDFIYFHCQQCPSTK